MGSNSLDAIKSSLDELKTSQGKIISSINNTNNNLSKLNKKFDDMMKSIATLSEENKVLTEKINLLENKYDSLEKKVSASQIPTEQVLISEIMDRQSRSCNVIIFNLPEPNKDSHSSETDNDKLKTIFSAMKSNISKFTCSRLGKLNSNTLIKPRPLKVVLSNSTEVFTVLRSQAILRNSSLWSNIRMASDRTSMQRDFMNNLREQLLKQRDNGENDLIIKYVKGIPSIINKNQNF